MTKILGRSLLLMAVVTLCSAAQAKAADIAVLKAQVPFDFVANGQLHHRGDYQVDEFLPGVFTLRGSAPNESSFVMTIPSGGADPAGAKPALVFRMNERNQHQLAQIWTSTHTGSDLVSR